VATFVALLVLGLPLAWTMGATAVIFTVGLFEPSTMFMTMTRVFHMMLNYTLVSVPLFVLMGCILEKSGVAEQLFDAVYVWSGRLRGGLAIGTIIACVVMAAMVGIVGAEIVTFGLIALPQMLDRGYDKGLALGCITSGGGMATLIPPSVVFIVYGMTAGVSIGDLFIAGIIPGILIGLGQILVAYIISKRQGYGSEEPFSLRTAWSTGIRSIPVVLLAGIIIGGIMGGIFTPTEAAAVAVIYAFVLSAFVYRDLTVKSFYTALKESALITGSVMLVISVANLLGWVLAYAKIPQLLVNPVLSLTSSPVVFMWLASLVLIAAGVFMHGTAMLVVLAPLFLPIVAKLGIHPLQFAMVFIMCWGIGQQTPPVASALFITCSLAEVDMWTVTKANVPFIAVLVGVLAGIIHLPTLFVFWVPRMFGLM
ncbi:MAG: TRAP transporter large permease, partial [Zetaproteobacteria bacterium]